MASIDTLVQDVYSLFGSDHEPSEENIQAFAHAVAEHMRNAFKKHVPKRALRGSAIGDECQKKTVYSVVAPELAEEIQPWVKHKFLYGNIIEEMQLLLIKEAGHTVEHEQKELELQGVTGHIDAIIDGHLCDVKSANSRGMFKFKDHRLEQDDPFGYLNQLDFYRAALGDSDETFDKRKPVCFIAVDKELGHIVLDKYERSDEDEKAIREAVADDIAAVDRARSDGTMPPRGHFPVPDGRSGNMQLDLPCRYCAFKKDCWPTLRTFRYANGPRFLTTTKKVPDVPEVK